MTRDEAYRHFGPKLIEAIVRKIVDEINIIRARESLPERTKQQIIDAIVSEYQSLPDYDWMGEE